VRRGRTLVLATRLRTSLSSQRAKPDLAIWAHQARQISGQALEAHVEANRNQRSLAASPIVRYIATIFRALAHIVLWGTEPSGHHH